MASGNKGLLIGLGIGCGVAAIVVVAIMVGCYMCADRVADTVAPLPTEEPAVAGMPSSPETQVPWLEQARGYCARYESAPNDILRSSIFREAETFVRGKTVSARGTLDHLSTGHGGGDLSLAVGVGEATFSASGLDEGEPLYLQAASLVPGTCVEFVGEVVALHAGFERDRVCELGYTIEFESIGRCEGPPSPPPEQSDPEPTAPDPTNAEERPE